MFIVLYSYHIQITQYDIKMLPGHFAALTTCTRELARLPAAVATEGPQREMFCWRSAPGASKFLMSFGVPNGVCLKNETFLGNILHFNVGILSRQDPYLKAARKHFQQQPNALPIGEAKGPASKSQSAMLLLSVFEWSFSMDLNWIAELQNRLQSSERWLDDFAPMGPVQPQPGLQCWQWSQHQDFRQFHPFFFECCQVERNLEQGLNSWSSWNSWNSWSVCVSFLRFHVEGSCSNTFAVERLLRPPHRTEQVTSVKILLRFVASWRGATFDLFDAVKLSGSIDLEAREVSFRWPLGVELRGPHVSCHHPFQRRSYQLWRQRMGFHLPGRIRWVSLRHLNLLPPFQLMKLLLGRQEAVGTWKVRLAAMPCCALFCLLEALCGEEESLSYCEFLAAPWWQMQQMQQVDALLWCAGPHSSHWRCIWRCEPVGRGKSKSQEFS